MSLITRCPACGTMFKVVPDQLRISEGWVRCGHCAEIFDASVHLQQDEPLMAAHPEPHPEPQVEPFDPFGAAPQPQPPSDPFDEPLFTSFTPVPDSAVSMPVDGPLEAPAILPLAQQASGAPAADPEPHEVSELSADLSSDLSSDVSFVRDARRKAFWRRPAVRALLLVVALLLAVLLVLQVALNDRDRLAAAEPSLRPLLLALCEPLACGVGPPRQIDAIVIDSSSFSKLRSDAYRLNFTLKNQAPNEVAMPSIELTLTDAQDQPLLRRVLMPADLGAKSPVIDASGEWSGVLALAVAGSGGARVAGYRVLAFYP